MLYENLGHLIGTSRTMLPTVASLSRLRSAAIADTAPRVSCCAHTRWASVGAKRQRSDFWSIVYISALPLNEFDARTKMAGSGNSDADCSSVLKKLGLQPVTRCSLAKFYVPAFGTASYTAMSVNVMNPSLVIK